jgi:hypothetical protein
MPDMRRGRLRLRRTGRSVRTRTGRSVRTIRSLWERQLRRRERRPKVRATAESALPFPFAGLPAETRDEPVPDALFDPHFYLAQLPNPAAAADGPRKHFDQYGRAAGYAPSLGAVYVAEAIRERASVSGTPMQDIVELLPPQKRQLARTDEVWKRLRVCAHPRLYRAQLTASELEALGGDLDLDRTVCHYLAHGVYEDKRVCALFNPDWYLEQLDRAGIVIGAEWVPLPGRIAAGFNRRNAKGPPSFLHWLAIGWNRQIVPTPLFHEDFYREHYSDIARLHPWTFVHFLKEGCYEPDRLASPHGRHHPGGADPQARERQAPLLLRDMLYRAERYDLSRTSWPEEGARAAWAKYEALHSPRMTELVARAADIEPLVLRPTRNYPVTNTRPYRSRRLHLDQQAEDLRRAVGRVHVDTVILVPGGKGADSLLEQLLPGVGWDSVLVVATDGGGTAQRSKGAPENTYFDLLPFLDGMEENFRLDLLLDLARGLTPERIVVVRSDLGWDLLGSYGRQLSARASLGAYVPEADGRTERIGRAVRRFETCFVHLDWALVDSAAQAEELIHRYALPSALAERLVPLGDHAVERALALPRRRRYA